MLSRRFPKTLALLALAGILGLAALFASLWMEHRTGITLPAPTGSFPVGLAIYDWTDPAHSRELLVRIWYPAAGQSEATEYLPAPVRAQVRRDRGALIGFFTRDLSHVRPHGMPNADVSTRQPAYPVVIFRGGASSEVWNYSTLAEDLASHGYVVVGFDAPYRTNLVVFPDGRSFRRLPANNPENCLGLRGPAQAGCMNGLLHAWTADMAFVLDRLQSLQAQDASSRFARRLDFARVGVFGHSFGGAQAAQFCHDDPRCKAGIDLDGAPFGSVVTEGLQRPFMFVLSDHRHESDPDRDIILAHIQSIYDSLPADRRMRISIRGAYHFGFSDDGALLKSHIVLRTLRLCGVIGLDGRRQLAVTAHVVHTFFDACLKGDGVSLRIPSPLYPEIQLE